jgi:hypothetical protein
MDASFSDGPPVSLFCTFTVSAVLPARVFPFLALIQLRVCMVSPAGGPEIVIRAMAIILLLIGPMAAPISTDQPGEHEIHETAAWQ